MTARGMASIPSSTRSIGVTTQMSESERDGQPDGQCHRTKQVAAVSSRCAPPDVRAAQPKMPGAGTLATPRSHPGHA